jgi:hypothetical protein
LQLLVAALARGFSRDATGDPAALSASGFAFEFLETERGTEDAIGERKRGQGTTTAPRRAPLRPSPPRSARAPACTKA